MERGSEKGAEERWSGVVWVVVEKKSLCVVMKCCRIEVSELL